jgi:hypothetical protein
MNAKDRAILIGLVLGDGHIQNRVRFKDGKYRYEQADIRLGHCPAQKEYLEHKVEMLHRIFGGKKPTVREKFYTLKATGKTYPGFVAEKTNPYFRLLHKWIYENKKKKVTKELLEWCDDHTLALLFMDDGSMIFNKNKAGEITSLYFRITTQFDNQDEADALLRWLSQFGIEAKKFQSKGRWDIGGGTQATLNLVHVIQQYLVPCMMYKIMPAVNFVIRKSARHPHFSVDEDIVRSVGKKDLQETL